MMESELAHQPRRGSDVEAWLMAKRDEQHHYYGPEWHVIDQLLDEYRLRADIGLMLSEEMDDA
jgi:hypothetical protein